MQKQANSNTKNPQGKNQKKEVPKQWKDRISKEDYEQLRDMFLIFDQDGSGAIDPQQIVKVLEDLGLDKRNPYVVNIVWALREKNKVLNFDQFVQVVCEKTGQNRTRDGIKKVFDLYDKDGTGQIGFQQLKQISKFIGQNFTDQDILEMMHSVFITKGTQSNQKFNFEEFYQVVTHFHKKAQ